MRTTLQSSDIVRFRDAIGRRLGLYFDDSRLGSLADLLARKLEETQDTVHAYLSRLESTARGGAELRELVADLTVPETYFFRHNDQFRAFAEIALPECLAARTSSRPLSLLSAGCATGEEAYSLAILLRERGLGPGSASIRGLDINPAVLEKARRGRYSTWALRETPEEFKSRWFAAEGREFVLDSTVRSAVTFEETNLSEDDPAHFQPNSYDIVFFRNVVMYFTPEHALAVIHRITRALAPGGYLFLGHAETLRGISDDFHLCHTHNTFYYRRKSATASQSRAPGRRSAPPARSPITISRNEASPAPASDGTWVETIRDAADRVKVLSDKHQASPTREPGSPRLATADLGAALELLKGERFADALLRLDDLPAVSARNADALLLRAVLLTHGGQLEAAEVVCRELLALDELNAAAHYLLALCREGLGDLPGAIEQDQVAIYLDKGFAMPRLHLGLMARRAARLDEARRELEQASRLLAMEDASRLLLFGGGFGREGLVALCRAELARMGISP